MLVLGREEFKIDKDIILILPDTATIYVNQPKRHLRLMQGAREPSVPVRRVAFRIEPFNLSLLPNHPHKPPSIVSSDARMHLQTHLGLKSSNSSRSIKIFVAS